MENHDAVTQHTVTLTGIAGDLKEHRAMIDGLRAEVKDAVEKLNEVSMATRHNAEAVAILEVGFAAARETLARVEGAIAGQVIQMGNVQQQCVEIKGTAFKLLWIMTLALIVLAIGASAFEKLSKVPGL